MTAPKNIQRRGRVIWVFALIALLACALQLFNIQIVKGAELAEEGRSVRTRTSALDAPRGAILDVNGQVLVETQATYHIAVNQKAIGDYRRFDDEGELVGQGPAEAARLLAPLLHRDPTELGGEMIGDSTYRYLARDVDAKTYRAIRALRIYGIEWEPSFERVYPSGSTAASVLGSVDSEGNGNAGLELTFNDLLVGTAGQEAYEVGPTGAVMPGAKTVIKEALPGQTIHTTLHSDLQHSVERLLDEAVAQNGAQWGAVVVLEVGTGNVLALADSNNQNPALGPSASRAVQMVYEPGSTFKVVTFGAALEEGTITPLTEFTVPDQYEIGGQVFKDLAPHETQRRTATGILAESSNTGTVMVGATVPEQRRYDISSAFGFGKPTGIELPGESGGILHTPQEWDGRMRYTTMFGQGVAVTAIQSAVMASVIANDGVWVAPTLVQGFSDQEGNFHEPEPTDPVQVLRPEVAQTLLLMMESVAEAGTGGLAQVEGYRSALKTGTAENPGGGIVPSMIGVVPADQPVLAISAVLYDPKNTLTAGVSVAPLFAQVSAEALRSLSVPPSKEAPVLYPSEPTSAG